MKLPPSTLLFILLFTRGGRLHAGEHPIRVTTLLVSHAGVPDEASLPIGRALDSALRRNPRLEMKDLETRLAEFAQDMPEAQIAEGRRLHAEGDAALAALDLSTATGKLEQAVAILSNVLPFIKKEELADAMMALGAGQTLQANRRSGHATFVHLLTWRSNYLADANRYSPQILSAFEEARKEVERARRGSLEIRSEPAAAQAYVDGRYVGVTPITVEGLVAGKHFVTWKREGYRKAVRPALVSAKVQESVTGPLQRSSKYLLVVEALHAIERQLGSDRLDGDADTLREALFVDHAVLTRLHPTHPGAYRLEAYLYDLRSHRCLGQVRREVSAEGTARAMEDVAAALYLHVEYDWAAPQELKAAKRKLFYKTWWFWTVTGATVGGLIAAGAVLGTVLRPKDCGGAFCPEFHLQ